MQHRHSINAAALVLGAVMSSGFLSAQPAAGGWRRAAPLAEARQELYPEVLDGKIYVAGGILNPGVRYTASFDVYDPARDRWTRLAPLPEARHHVTLSAVNGSIYAIGGFSGAIPNWRAEPTMWVYSPAANRWTRGVDMPAPRAEGVAAVVNGRIYWIGGRAPSTPSAAHFNDHEDSDRNEMFDPATRRWSARAPAPTARNSAAAAVIGGKIYVVGGRRFIRSTDGQVRMTNYALLEVYDPERDRWETRAPMPRAQGGLGAAAVDGKLHACGGEQWQPEQAVMSECWSYDPATDRWQPLTPLPTARHGIGMAAVGRRLHVFGGATRAGGNFATAMHQVLQMPQ